MLFDRPNTNTIQEMLDKFAIKELIEYERFCRDNALWEQMHTCFADTSTVKVSWYQGSGYGFVDASSKMQARAPHKLSNTLVWMQGTHAVAIVMASIQSRKELDGRAMDLTSFVRLLYTVEKIGDAWQLQSLDSIYEKDCLIPAAPANLQPNAGDRASYGNLCRIIGADGYTIDQSLAGDDRPELTAELYRYAADWIAAGG